ncbi:MAG: LacI family DNA-binding transcriptional regulator [Prevotella sp.]|nr:LacI family DNA-binding transcriptional regulator [Prevotella sp.]
MAQQIRIKDIAQKAGVSVGTVDRVLHNRPNVSKKALEKVKKVLEEMDYQPNMYASALAHNRSYTFYLIMPKHASEAYWQEIEEGAFKARNARRDFQIEVKIIYYTRLEEDTFVKAYNNCLNNNPDGVIIVPAALDVTQQFTNRLHEKNIPFILLDSYMPELKPLSFYGQDSLSSGFFAAKMLMLLAAKEQEIMLMKMTKDGKVASRQQDSREAGFLHYMRDHHPNVTIRELCLPLDGDKATYEEMLEKFFTKNKKIHHAITFCSKAHIVGEFLLRTNRRNVQIMGYDMVQKNAECLRKGSISFLIAQHAYMQGYYCVETLFQAIVLKKGVPPVNYMPIEILNKENVDFYQRTIL